MAGTVLLVEDDSEILECLGNSLKEAGYTVVEASNGHEAKKRLETGRYDVVVTDIVMPDFDGLELVMHMNRAYPDTKVIVFSGYQDQLHLQTASYLGAHEVLPKPVTPSVLCGAIEKVLSG